jgi:hypothetical protein
MKKSLTLLALAFSFSATFAQELKSKKEEVYLPEAGDWALGIDATPFLNYAGNFFGKSANNTAPSWNWLNSAQTITGKYFSDAQTAFRGQLRIGLTSASTRTMVADRAATTTTLFPNGMPMKENSWKHSTSNIGLAGGIEMRRGKTRLQGYYGGEVGIYLGNSKDVFEYGNNLAPTATPAVVVDPAADAFAGSNNIDAAAPIQGILGSARVTERKNGSTFSFGVRGFIGAEYFVLPKISIGGEFGWGLGLTTFGASETTYQSVGFNGTTAAPGTTVVDGSKSGGFSLDTDNVNGMWGPSASLRLNLHF